MEVSKIKLIKSLFVKLQSEFSEYIGDRIRPKKCSRNGVGRHFGKLTKFTLHAFSDMLDPSSIKRIPENSRRDLMKEFLFWRRVSQMVQKSTKSARKNHTLVLTM